MYVCVFMDLPGNNKGNPTPFGERQYAPMIHKGSIMLQYEAL